MNYEIEFNQLVRERYIKQINDLITMADKILDTKEKLLPDMEFSIRDKGLSAQWKISSLSLLEDLFGIEGTFYKEFKKNIPIAEGEKEIIQGKAILLSARAKLEAGLPANLQLLIFYLQNMPKEKRPVGFQDE